MYMKYASTSKIHQEKKYQEFLCYKIEYLCNLIEFAQIDIFDYLNK